MTKELYFDISKEEAGGSLYRVQLTDGTSRFIYSHSQYNSNTDEIKVFETSYADFGSFWQYLLGDPRWFYQHPLFVHPEQRAFVKAELSRVNWGNSNKKWQESHQRQWKKVLESPGQYYRGS